MIISFGALGKHGRLGNQLFQIASTMGLAEKYGAQAAFPAWPYAEYFENYLPRGERQPKRVTEAHFHYYDPRLTESCDLFGYFQSYKYFGGEKLRLKPQFVEAMRSKLEIWDKKVICLQVRRGDYVGNPNYHQLSPGYYLQALEKYFPNWRECNLLFISDDIEYCRTHFEALPNSYFSKGLTDIEEMALASNCNSFIISNSTFGWWTAWFASKGMPGVRKVIYPDKMFAGPQAHFETKDYWPIQWQPFERMDYRLDLKDVTFTIPVYFDHKDRKNNLDLSVCLLQRDLKAEYIIMEQGGDKFKYTEAFSRYMQFGGGLFHRTKMLNEMAKATETRFIVNWDCDVFVPPAQLWLAVQMLREDADIVYPFDGRFARMPRQEWFPKIQKALDIGVVGATRFKNRESGHYSTGGAVMFKKTAFLRGGGENEKMLSFGPEDHERHDRFKKLGFTIQRTGGSLFHMDHFVGPNSSQKNPYFVANHEEYQKIKNMSQEALWEYINSWPWKI